MIIRSIQLTEETQTKALQTNKFIETSYEFEINLLQIKLENKIFPTNVSLQHIAMLDTMFSN